MNLWYPMLIGILQSSHLPTESTLEYQVQENPNYSKRFLQNKCYDLRTQFDVINLKFGDGLFVFPISIKGIPILAMSEDRFCCKSLNFKNIDRISITSP